MCWVINVRAISERDVKWLGHESDILLGQGMGIWRHTGQLIIIERKNIEEVPVPEGVIVTRSTNISGARIIRYTRLYHFLMENMIFLCFILKIERFGYTSLKTYQVGINFHNCLYGWAEAGVLTFRLLIHKCVTIGQREAAHFDVLL